MNEFALNDGKVPQTLEISFVAHSGVNPVIQNMFH